MSIYTHATSMAPRPGYRPTRSISRAVGGAAHNERLDEPLSDEELELFVQYLHRFANHNVDISVWMEAGDLNTPSTYSSAGTIPRSETLLTSAALRGPAAVDIHR